ncbi:MAG: OmpA family protein [Brevinematales bacterium]|nr:OmpA family protein [Brevinematales bacterium]
MKKLLIFIFTLLSGLSYSLPAGSEFFYLPLGISGNGSAYSSSCSSLSSGNFFVNPSLGSSFSGLSFFSGYFFVKDFPYFLGGVGVPIYDYKLTIGTKISGNHNSGAYREAGSYYSGVIGLSRKVVNNFLVGLNFDFSYLLKREFQDISYTFDFGFLYKFVDIFTDDVFCIKDSYFGATVYGIGKQAIYEDRDGIPPLGLRTGLKTTVFDSKFIDFSIGSEVNYNFLIGEFFCSLYLNSLLFDSFGLSFGYLYGNKNIGNFTNGFYPFTFGASFHSIIGNTPFSIFYSLNQVNFNFQNELIHFVGLEFNFETFDKTLKPILTMGDNKTNYSSFSPNYDREKDSIIFNIFAQTNRPVEHWELVIFDEKGRIARRFKDSVPEEYNLFKLFARIFEAKEYTPIPSYIEWDGISDSGSVMPEGNYFAIFSIINGSLTNSSETNYIKLDLTPPYGAISLDDIYFSPNNDGIKDNLILYPSFSKDNWQMQIFNKSGENVFSIDYLDNIPKVIKWNGFDQNGKPLPKGLYDILFFGKDEAGNKNILYVSDVLLSTDKYIVYLLLKKEVSFSLNTNLSIKIFTVPEDVSISKYKLEIFKDRVIRNIEGKGRIDYINWDGKDNAGNIVKDGKYFLVVYVEFENGERAKSEKYELIVDSTPPIVKFNMENIPFSPDGDGENDSLKINAGFNDLVGLDWAKLRIYDPDKRLFKEFLFKDSNNTIYWDGRSELGELVESAQDYQCEIEAKDKLGNLIRKNVASIPTDILVEKIDRGYKIRINNIEFEFNKYEIMPKSIPILKRLVQILRKYPDYEIEIHGHTDNIGSESYNLKLSRQRAESVYNFLKKEGISNRMTSKGFGFKHPLADNNSEEGRRKNRRVEFILKR